MMSQKNNTKRNNTNIMERMEKKCSRELTSSSSLTSMSQLSNSSEETLEAFIYKSHRSDNLEK